ncbi:hypothetical protein NL676_024002, partial [Syzygium grande]
TDGKWTSGELKGTAGSVSRRTHVPEEEAPPNSCREDPRFTRQKKALFHLPHHHHQPHRARTRTRTPTRSYPFLLLLLRGSGQSPRSPTATDSRTHEGLTGNRQRAWLACCSGSFLCDQAEGWEVPGLHREGFGSSKEMNFPVSRELIEKLGIYIVLYDRAGYGHSDMNSKRKVKSEALDIQELAERLQLGSKFYVIGVSMGSYPTWSCLKYIPDRLAGVALVVPTVNYRWPSLPESLTKPDYRKKLIRWSLRIASHAPGLLQWLFSV